MTTITMDNSCFDTGDSDIQDILEELFKLKEKGKIEIFREKYSYAEKRNYEGERKNEDLKLTQNISKRQMDAMAYPYPLTYEEEIEYRDINRGFSDKDFSDVYEKLLQIVYPEGLFGKELNKRIDLKTLAAHIVRKRKYFVTKDKVFHKKDEKYKKLEATFPWIKIRLLNNKFLNEFQKDLPE